MIFRADADLCLPLRHAIQTGERTADVFPVPVAVMPGKTDVKRQKMELVDGQIHKSVSKPPQRYAEEMRKTMKDRTKSTKLAVQIAEYLIKVGNVK